MAKMIISVFFGVFLGFHHFTESAKPKYVSVNLNAKWSSTPLISEISEYLAQDSNDVFWKFVDAVAQSKIMVDLANEKKSYEFALDICEQIGLSRLQINLLEFSVSLRTNSPTVAMHDKVAHEKLTQQNCEAFIDTHDILSCDINDIEAKIQEARDIPYKAFFKSDHSYPTSYKPSTTIILYAEIGSEIFKSYHKKLKSLADAGEVYYIFRHYVKNASEYPLQLAGYGVELAIKSQEYKAKDDTKVSDENKAESEDIDDDTDIEGFHFSKLKLLHPELATDLDVFKEHLIESTSEMAPLKVWQLQDLDMQAAQRIMSAPLNDTLKIFRDTSQNFPMMARSLSKVKVTPELRKEMGKNSKFFEQHLGMERGESALYINGLQANLETYDAFTLLETLRKEANVMNSLHNLGIKGNNLLKMLKINFKDKASYSVDIRDSSVKYINDLQTDDRYKGWPSSVQDLLRPTFPGMLRHLRKNFFHLVYFVDPSRFETRHLLKMAEALLVHNAPVKMGLVFVVNDSDDINGFDDAGVALSRAFRHIEDEEGGAIKAISFITDVYDLINSQEDLTVSLIVSEFKNTFRDADVQDVFKISKSYNHWRKDAKSFYVKTGLGALPQVLLNGVPFSPDDLSDDNFEEAVVSSILDKTGDFQKAVYENKINDRTDLLEHIMSQPNVMPRLNSRILTPTGEFLQFSKSSDSGSDVPFSKLDNSEMSEKMMNEMKYLCKKDDVIFPVTLWVVADLESSHGRLFLYEALKAQKNSNDIRIGVIHNLLSAPSEDFSIVKAVQVAMETLDTSMAKSFIIKLLKDENIEALKNGEKSLEDLAVHNMDMESYSAALKVKSLDFLTDESIYINRVLKFDRGERGVIANGKILGPLSHDEIFTLDDFSLLQKYTLKSSAEKIKSPLSSLKLDLDNKALSDLLMKVSAQLLSNPQTESRHEIDYYGDSHSVIKIPAANDGPAYDVTAILNPASRAAQKYVPIVMVLSQVANVNLRIFLNAKEKLSEMPLKSFYRYVLDPYLTFTDDNKISKSLSAKFMHLPEKPVLTLGMDTPESWLVQSVVSPHDLDNIYLEEVESGVHADFELEYLLIEGHCYDSNTGQPPRGLQFVLGTQSSPAQVDTIVMANLGYFQLKAAPGAWLLELRLGRSRDIYDITSHDYTDSHPDSKDVLVVIDSFKSKIIKLKVSKKPGKEYEDLLGSSENSNAGIWDSISSFWDTNEGSFKNTESLEDQDKTINIFSVASGHLYERLLRIMIMSVLKNTQSKVKFWFLKNYLSPSFKDFIPYYAEKYGFEYELVQYKWPRWLHQQTEKQRTIWGYKILFLDVLFPLDVQKIIFVDADQIVRTDIQELVDFDLGGAPYGYTPFCESRKEMDGFRFWKSGYWANHLAGRKYHISALYVVDLKKFRKIAAGDRLRGQYQGLSQDPNSLSNLDQDLPNNMIHQVAIKSLPQDWLWCETWCSDASKKTAKTIDLCNNPLTKESKLTAAMRIVPEWKDYDEEIKDIWNTFYHIQESNDNKSEDSSKNKKEEL